MRLLAGGRAWLGSALMRLGFRIAGGPSSEEVAQLDGDAGSGDFGWDAPPVEIGERGRELLREGRRVQIARMVDAPAPPLAGSLADRRARARAGA
jgi:hypothetical protein